MSWLPKRRVLLYATGILIVLLVAYVPSSGRVASSVSQDRWPTILDGNEDLEGIQWSEAPAAPAAPSACPPNPTGLDEEVERTDFCVYYSHNSITDDEAEWAADWVQDYWDRFVALGFNEPKHSGKLEVHLLDTTGCNGGTAWDINYMTTYAGCFSNDELAQKVLGHELTHRVQYNHDTSTGAPVQTKFLKEGTARASEDNWFANIDNWPLALSFPSSFNSEVNAYLLNTNRDITSYDMRYMSCLWWKYASEQYGTTTTEPERGVDFFLQVFNQNTAGHKGVAAVNQALSAMGTGTTFNKSFRRFAAANWMKDLNGVPDGSYNYIDEDEAENPGPYGPLQPEDKGAINSTTDRSWSNEWINRYGIEYYAAEIDASCPVVTASFHRDFDTPAFYHVVTQDMNAFHTHVEGSGEDWTQAFLNDGITKILAIVGSLESGSQVDVTLGCASPVLDIIMPNSGAPAYVTPGSHFLAQVQVTDGSPTGPVVAGLTNDDFSAQVGGTDAAVVNGGFIQEQYWLVIQAPSLADGTYGLEITLEEPGTGTPIASDTNANSVVYDEDTTDQVLVIDRSGSMGVDGGAKMAAAQEAANFYVDVTRDDDGLAVVPYNGDVNPAPFDLTVVGGAVRDNAEDYINALTASGMTSIGDGLDEAVNQRSGSTTGNTRCSFVLLSDGMENSPEFWADVESAVKDIGCPVTTIAFGPASDETLMQTIATETGGAFQYNDVYVSTHASAQMPGAASEAEMALELDDLYEYVQAQGEGRQRLFQEEGQVSEKLPTGSHQVLVDDSISEVVFALDWFSRDYAELILSLETPGGNVIDDSTRPYTFKDLPNGHVGWRIPKPEPGKWKMIVKHAGSEFESVRYQVLASAHTGVTLNLLLPDRLNSRFFTGNLVPIYAFLSGQKPIAGARVEAWVTAPDGTETHLWLFDDGEHGDGGSSDGFYAGRYTRVNQAAVVYPQGEEGQPVPNEEGAYRVRVRATTGEVEREAKGGFSVLASPDENENRLPDMFEREYGVSDPGGDPDGDKLNNYGEYLAGTDPNDSDTDDGGENDGSEVTHQRDPLDRRDDHVNGPEFFEVLPWYKGLVRLLYDVKPNYAAMYLRRIPLGRGAQLGVSPMSAAQVIEELPLTGAYTDTTATSGVTYAYQIWGVDQDGAESGLFDGGAVRVAEDPVRPEARLLINGGAFLTVDQDVTISLAPYEQEGEETASFEDIAEIMLSNDPSFAGASWQVVADPATFQTTWTLDATPGTHATVYARFRDSATPANESTTHLSTIYLQGPAIYLPMVVKAG